MAEYQAKTVDNKCIFCEIIAKRIDAGIYWENDEFMAFLATFPSTEGFSCVVPKTHFGSDVLKMPDDVLQRFILTVKEVSSVIENYYADVGRVGLMMEGTGIDHAHIKLMPLHGTEHLKRGEWKQALSTSEVWFDTYKGYITSQDGPDVPLEKLKELAEKIKNSKQ